MKIHDNKLNGISTSVNKKLSDYERWGKNWYHKNKKHALQLCKKWAEKNKEERKAFCDNYVKRNPFTRLMTVRIGAIKNRCNNPNNPRYSNYGGRGIECFLTRQELETIWERDKANKMLRPTIDRIDNNGNYTFKNCRIIENRKNVLKGWRDTTISLKEKAKIISQIRKYLKKNKMNPYQLSKKLKIAPSTPHFWLYGRKCRMKKRTVEFFKRNGII